MQITFSNFKRHKSDLYSIMGNIAASSVKSAKATVEDITEQQFHPYYYVWKFNNKHYCITLFGNIV